MVIERTEILNFKNIPDARIEFSEGVNCLLGRNGMGKSNLLEALHFACMARPMSPLPESGLIRHGEGLMSVRADFRMDSGLEEKVSVGIVKGKGKTLKRNGKEYDRLSRHIGAFPVVSVTPADTLLPTGPSQDRRRMADMVISQASAPYLAALTRYTRALESRNGLLRSGASDPLLYESVESVMTEAAAVVYDHRRRWVESVAPLVAANYAAIASESGGERGEEGERGESGERLTMGYKSVLSGMTMAEVLAANRGRDRALGYTSAGVHRDDITADLDGYPLRSFGSQGQLKSFTVALRLAIFSYLRDCGGETPLLLLDDIFDKLDSRRVGAIMRLVSRSDAFGQIFITDTNREHLDETLAALDGPRRLITVEDGVFTTITEN